MIGFSHVKSPDCIVVGNKSLKLSWRNSMNKENTSAYKHRNNLARELKQIAPISQ